ncbi:ANK [Mytilus edulis]|uniref:ANK n=1 Tax=Mytilus edulis TaxID=6550 RepID=A0A8S3SVY8_MYTED|nr:ANK [Mytilus edulis]
MENEQFRDSLLTQLLHRDKAEQSQLSRISETSDVRLLMGSLEICCLRGFTNLLPWFVNLGVDINQCTHLITPLTAACLGNKIEMIFALLHLGANINKSGSSGITPLHWLCSGFFIHDQDVFDLLLKNGACTNERMFNGSTPLLVSLSVTKRETANIVKTLLSHSADCNIGFYNSQAIKDGYRKFSKILGDTIEDIKDISLEMFSNKFPSSVVDYVNQEPNTEIHTLGSATPLHLMCFTNDIDMIKLLLERNPDINKCKEDGSTPLFVACLFGFIDITTILLEHGANRDICRNDGTSPLDIAKQKKHNDIILLLENPKWRSTKSDKKRKKKNLLFREI